MWSTAAVNMSIVQWSFMITNQDESWMRPKLFSRLFWLLTLGWLQRIRQAWKRDSSRLHGPRAQEIYRCSKSVIIEKAGKPEKALNFINKLYGVEKKAKGLDAKFYCGLRRIETKLILDEFKQWLEDPNVLPKCYSEKQLPTLKTSGPNYSPISKMVRLVSKITWLNEISGRSQQAERTGCS